MYQPDRPSLRNIPFGTLGMSSLLSSRGRGQPQDVACRVPYDRAETRTTLELSCPFHALNLLGAHPENLGRFLPGQVPACPSLSHRLLDQAAGSRGSTLCRARASSSITDWSVVFFPDPVSDGADCSETSVSSHGHSIPGTQSQPRLARFKAAILRFNNSK